MDRLRAAALAVLVLLAGCSTPTATSTVRPTLAPVTPTPAIPTMDIEQPGLTPGAGQVDTDWGPIWETLPPGFPQAPGAREAEADDVVSAALTVPASSLADPRQVASFYGQAFSGAGYGGGIDGPYEDGSYQAWASNGYGCDMLVQAVPRGSEETYVTVLYGAGCPFEWAAQ